MMLALLASCLLSTAQASVPAAEPLVVVTTMPYIADIARSVGGPHVRATALIAPGVDPHHVELTPKQITELRGADLFLENGMQLEAWAPRVLEASGRRDLAQGAAAHAFVTNGIAALEIPTEADLAGGGHVHAAGNPHAWLDPRNLKTVATNVADALARVRPAERDGFQARKLAFEKRLDQAFYGAELEALVGGRTLERLQRGGRLIAFLESREVDGAALIDRLGGWLGRARALPTKRLISYHRTWSYLEAAFELEIVATLEEKPGIPPGPAYLESLSQLAADQGVRLVIAPPYYPRVNSEGFAERIDGVFQVLPTQPGEAEDTFDVFALFDRILDRLEAAGAAR
ncbi:MAG: metal ABC transporter substrate-binding protein [Planctomycetota bacterium]